MKLVISYLLSSLFFVSCQEISEQTDEIEVKYVTPTVPKGAYFVDHFDDKPLSENKWIMSQAKKEGVDADIAKYDGVWSIESQEQSALIGDLGLVLKSKAKHAAISSMLNRPFVFKDKPFIVQYEVNLQNGQDCGGSYIKLLTQPKSGKLNLKEFTDKTPYTIMFGPDKCGNDFKFHFIFRHVNPLNGTIEEKHCKRPKTKFEDIFKDKRPHLYTLILKPDNTYQIKLDHDVINEGSLIEDFTPSINPPREIDDPNDKKPSDWDDREKIDDPNASKPDDWDEDAPMKIVDEFVSMPEGWLEEEPKLIPDPSANMPDDWDDEMDGDWSAPLINNPKCENAPGCGKWERPTIDNPEYKGKWKAPTIDNPNYKGVWSPRKIPNPDFFEDLEPFKMSPIGAVGLELWSMSENIYFDNFIITDDEAEAKLYAASTFDLKVFKIDKGDKSIFRKIVEYSNENPWVYGLYVILFAIPVVIIYMCCCAGDAKEDKDAMKKKTDEPTEDDPQGDDEVDERKAGSDADNQESEDEQSNEDEDEPEEDSKEEEEVKTRSPRLRKARRD